MCNEFIVIGIDDSRSQEFSREVELIIKTNAVFSGGNRHHENVLEHLPSCHTWIDITVPLSEVFAKYSNYEKVVVFASGDPLFYGIGTTLKREFPASRIRIYPSFNILQQMCHHILLPYHDMRIVSLTGRPWHEFDAAVISVEKKIGVLTDKEHTPSLIAQRLIDYGYTDYDISVGEKIGNERDERVGTYTLREATETEFQQPNVVVLQSKEEQNRRRYLGIPDELFESLPGRPGMITKAAYRILSLSALELKDKHVLWDIGYCTGSVSIEAKLLYPHLHVYSFEKREECEHLLDENSRRFGAMGIESTICDFLTYDVSCLPRPDAVFIGGHGGRLEDMFMKIANYLMDDGTVVMNSVTEQSRSAFVDACKAVGFSIEKSHHVSVDDYNPIEIMKCRK